MAEIGPIIVDVKLNVEPVEETEIYIKKVVYNILKNELSSLVRELVQEELRAKDAKTKS